MEGSMTINTVELNISTAVQYIDIVKKFVDMEIMSLNSTNTEPYRQIAVLQNVIGSLNCTRQVLEHFLGRTSTEESVFGEARHYRSDDNPFHREIPKGYEDNNGWYPIESVPKDDSTSVDLIYEDDNGDLIRVTKCRFIKGNWCSWTTEAFSAGFHWVVISKYKSMIPIYWKPIILPRKTI